MKLHKILITILPFITSIVSAVTSCSYSNKSVSIDIDTGIYSKSLVTLSNKTASLDSDYFSDISLVDTENYYIDDIPFIIVNNEPVQKSGFTWDGKTIHIFKEHMIDKSVTIYIKIMTVDDSNKFDAICCGDGSVSLRNTQAELYCAFTSVLDINRESIHSINKIWVTVGGKELEEGKDFTFNAPNRYVWVRGGAITIKNLEITVETNNYMDISFSQCEGVTHGDDRPWSHHKFKTLLEYDKTKYEWDHDIVDLSVSIDGNLLEINKDFFYDGNQLTIIEEAMVGKYVDVTFRVDIALNPVLHYTPGHLNPSIDGGIWDGLTINSRARFGIKISRCVVEVGGKKIEDKYITIKGDVITIDKSVCVSSNFDITLETEHFPGTVSLIIEWNSGRHIEYSDVLYLDDYEFEPYKTFKTKIRSVTDCIYISNKPIWILCDGHQHIEGDGSFEINRETGDLEIYAEHTDTNKMSIIVYVDVFALGLDCHDACSMKLVNNGSSNPDLEYSSNGLDWTVMQAGQTMPICASSTSSTILIRGKNDNQFSTSEENYSSIELSSSDNGSIDIWGTVDALIYSSSKDVTDTIPNDYCFYRLFANSHANLTIAKETEEVVQLPLWSATTLKPHCFESMFENCDRLKNAPYFTRAALADFCYLKMFKDCKSLTDVTPIIGKDWKEVEGHMSNGPFAYMFQNCTDLVNGPSFDDLIIGQYTYDHMFDGCINLTNVKNLRCNCNFSSATQLIVSIGTYQYMFHNCRSFNISDEEEVDLHYDETTEENMTDKCFAHMFEGCSCLTYVPDIEWPRATGQQCCEYMFAGCASLVNAPNLKFWVLSNIKTGCFSHMFEACTSLQNIHLSGWTGQLPQQHFDNWVSGVPLTGGIFYYTPSDPSYTQFGPSAIPGDPNDESKRWVVQS